MKLLKWFNRTALRVGAIAARPELFLLQEAGDFILLEDGNKIILE